MIFRVCRKDSVNTIGRGESSRLDSHVCAPEWKSVVGNHCFPTVLEPKKGKIIFFPLYYFTYISFVKSINSTKCRPDSLWKSYFIVSYSVWRRGVRWAEFKAEFFNDHIFGCLWPVTAQKNPSQSLFPALWQHFVLFQSTFSILALVHCNAIFLLETECCSLRFLLTLWF